MDVAFGFGRRVCPGKHIAHSTVMLAATSVLLTFNLLKKVDENCREIDQVGLYIYSDKSIEFHRAKVPSCRGDDLHFSRVRRVGSSPSLLFGDVLGHAEQIQRTSYSP